MGRRFGALALAVVVAAGAAATGALAQDEGGDQPHRQAPSGPAEAAGVPLIKAPSIIGGKGGGVDPGDDYPRRWKNRPQDSVLDQWKEYNRECTSFVAWALHSRNGFEMPFHHNANRWGSLARKAGYLVNSRPNLGSVAWNNVGFWGHVAYVVAVNGGNVTVEEYNFEKRGSYDKRIVATSAFTGFIHFKDLPGEQISAAESTLPNPPPAPTFNETTGGIANTWSDYVTASGERGPGIPSNTTIQVACAVSGFQVADGNTWWYRIASSPWNGAFYASADAFYNNGQTSGSLIGTPFVDPAVPAC